ncbi:sigma-70 family RNA polymerase sigma factor [Streptomyces lasiicapitis]|uniref:sigma-70 family RNA polymerase sigma factor n=1 Tax=Streptomyces lasiicapitis TaxID=1923961 RepID=UPI0036C13FED
MDEPAELADRFEAQRGRLRGVAYRMLGSLAEADDAVQETWLRLARTDAGAADGGERIENLPAWLTTVVSRVCLDMLRTRASRREDFVGGQVPDHIAAAEAHSPEEEALLIESVGRALLVVLDTLTPAERVAFVLHDSFAVPFDRIAPIVERSTAATKKLASRARGKVRGTQATSTTPATSTTSTTESAPHRHVVEAFLAAARGGDLDALLAVLAPDVVRRADPAALPLGAATEIHGAAAVARETVLLTRNAQHAALALINGAPGIVVAPGGRLLLALTLTVDSGRITSYEVIAAPARLRELNLAILPE